MTTSAGPARAAPLSRETAEELAAELAGEMIRRWRQGERPLAEDFLALQPQLWEWPEAAADLIYEELCLRQEYGPEVTLAQVLARFPQWRAQLEVLFDCQRVLGPSQAAPQFPSTGEAVGDFLLLAELGRGAVGRVFLASQTSLGGRPVVLKLTPLEACEHLSLARLQHTHIVPLYSVQDDPGRGLRALCMPYFGGATLDQLLQALSTQPSPRRTGDDLLEALDRGSNGLPLATCNASTPGRKFLAYASYADAVCWIGACLADALQYAHERGLLHLDLKPSNVLLAADGQPMLLDFHLAREPLHPGGASVPGLGGTTGYMSPEQAAAFRAIREGQVPPQPVDGRSDVYSLGLVLDEALRGAAPGANAPRLRCANPQVSVGLDDIIAKCLAHDPAARYPHMAALAADLRRHLADLPLVGVRNRNLPERWRKWRRRRPQGIARAGMLLTVLTALGAVLLGAASHFTQQIDEARTALIEGQAQIARGDGEGAMRSLQRGRSQASGLPFQHELAEELDRQLERAEHVRDAAVHAAAARVLHRLADRVRFLYGTSHFSPQDVHRLESSCRELWEKRETVVKRLDQAGPGDVAVRDDLLDVALFWAELQTHLVSPAEGAAARRKALEILTQAEALFGPNSVLDAERRHYGATVTGPRQASRTAWEHYALGRSLLRSGDLAQAAGELDDAVRLEPRGLWPNFYQGQCAYRLGRYVEAATAYSVCMGATPEAAGCFYYRGLAFSALGHADQALHDYDHAVELDPTLGVAFLNRGVLHLRAGRIDAAFTDLQRGRQLGADSLTASVALAVVRLARGQYAAAFDELRQILHHL